MRALSGYNYRESKRNDVYTTRHVKMLFSTYDSDNDGFSGGNCASEDGSGPGSNIKQLSECPNRSASQK